MLNIEGLNNILILLNLRLKRNEKGEYLISNYNSNITDRLSNSNGNYEYTFIKDDITYHLTINERTLIITNSLRETIIFNNEGFQYSEIKSNQDQNKSHVSISSNQISFYKSNDIKATQEDHYSIGMKAHTARNLFLFYKLSETIGLNGTLKKDTIITTDDNTSYEVNTTRHYNEAGSLTYSTEDGLDIEDDIDEYIIDKITTQDFIKELLSRIDDILPGLLNYLKNINPNMESIINNFGNKTKKKQ